jgi:hypothetical protein
LCQKGYDQNQKNSLAHKYRPDHFHLKYAHDSVHRCSDAMALWCVQDTS